MAMHQAKEEEKENRREQMLLMKMEQQERLKGQMTPYQEKKLELEQAKVEGKEAKKSGIPGNREALEEMGLLPENAVMLNELGDKGLIKERVKEIDARAKGFPSYTQNLKNYGKLREVINENPHLFASMGRMAKSKAEKDPTIWNNYLSQLKKKDVIAAQKIGKLTADIGINKIQALSGQTRMTDMMKSAVFAKLISDATTSEAGNMVIDMNEEEDLLGLDDAIAANKAKTYHYYIPRNSEMEEKYLLKKKLEREPVEEVPAPATNSSQANEEQKIDSWLQQNPEFADMNRNEARQIMKEEGLL
jgi:hypothetical protein